VRSPWASGRRWPCASGVAEAARSLVLPKSLHPARANTSSLSTAAPFPELGEPWHWTANEAAVPQAMPIGDLGLHFVEAGDTVPLNLRPSTLIPRAHASAHTRRLTRRSRSTPRVDDTRPGAQPLDPLPRGTCSGSAFALVIEHPPRGAAKARFAARSPLTRSSGGDSSPRC
jgi:hypothetical protein